MSDESKWDERYREVSAAAVKPVKVLIENAHLLPASGSALDLACGTGGNALFVAERGLLTSAWDISPVAIGKLRGEAERRSVTILASARDVVAAPPEPNSFDVIVVSRFLERELMPAIVAALRSGGLLFYQTFIRERVDNTGPNNPAYRLDDNELLRLCASLRIRVYREEGRLGDRTRGFRNEAMVVAQKP